MQRRLKGVAIFALAAAAAGLPVQAATAHPSAAKPVCDGSIRSVAQHSHARINACLVRPGRVMIETSYYQNASRVGGSALAAYPEARLRIGVLPGVEMFYDAPSEIAKSGLRGAGIYYMTRPGFGARIQLSRKLRSATSLAFEWRPRLDEMANMTLAPAWHATLSSQWQAARSNVLFGAEAGVLNYRENSVQRSALMLSGGAEKPVGPLTSLAVRLRTVNDFALGSSAQAGGAFSVLQSLGRDTLFNVELGTSFNRCQNIKAHYLAAGFALR